MSSVPSGNPVVVARYAGAVYGLAVDYDTQEFYANQGPLQLDAALNALYRNDFTWTSTDAFAANLIANLGITGEPAVSQAVAYVTGMLNATAPEVRGAAVAQMLNMFATMTTDPQYGTFAVAWNAKVGSALTYSANPNSATMIAFNDAASVVAAQGFTLTNGTDIATAHIFNAGMVYTPGGNDRIPSLQDEDKLTGTAATDDVLNATIGNFNDASSALITPTLSAIETLNAVFSNTDGSGLDLQDATGLTTVNVTRVNAGGATVLNMPATATTLSAAGSADFAPVTLTYRDAELAGDQTVDLTLSNVLATLLTVGAQNNVITQQIENLNLVVDSASYVQVLDTREDGVATTGQTINITADADFVLGFDADDDGNVIEHNTALLNGFGISSITVTGAGNVTLGEVGAADDIVGNAVVDSFTLDASALTGNLSANISNSAGDAQSTFTSGSGNDTLITGPAVFVPAPVPGFWTPGQALAGDVVTNGGNDSVTIGGALTATGSIASGDGNDAVVVAGQMAGSVAGGGSITLGAGDDTLVLGTINVTNLFTPVSMAEEATVSAGDGNDTVTLTGSMIGDTPLDTDDDLGSAIDMGAGDDAVVFDLTNQLAVGTLIGGSLAGGSGVNTLTVTGNATVTNVANFDPTAAPLTDAVTGFATLNLVSEQAYNAVLAAAINFIVPGTVLENDTDAGPNPQTADYTADLSEFTGVTTINLENQAGVTAVTENNSFEGDAAIYTLTNLAGTEAVTLTTVEAATGVAAARNVGGVTQAIIAADIAADATLNVGLADSTGAANTFAATLNGNGDVAVNDLAAGIYGQVTLPTQTNEIENLSLTIGGTTARSIILADSNFENTLTLAGSNTEAITVGGVVAAGNAVDLTNAVSASTITSTLTGVINLTVSDNEAHTITTASTGVGGAPVLTGSSDVVNMLNDTLTVADRINLGDGSANRIIVNDALRTAGADTDAVFKNISNVQVLELRGAAGNVSFDNDALATGINTVVLDLDFDGTADGAEAFVDLNIDAAFTRALSISMANESTLDIDNKGNGNLNITIAGREGIGRTAGDPIDTQLDFTDAGTGNVVNLTISTANVAQTIASFATGPQGIVLTNNATGADATPGDIDSITLLDSNTNLNALTATPANPYATQTGVINVAGSAQWAQAGDTLTVNASDINDDDGTAADEAGDVINEDTQQVVLNFGGMNYAVNLTGSEMDNGVVVLGAAGFDDVLTGGNVRDVISGGAGKDRITGGTGGDSLTGGSGADTFAYFEAVDSNTTAGGTDTISDFVSGTDKIEVNFDLSLQPFAPGESVNLASFSTVPDAGAGDNSLAGVPGLAQPKVYGDSYYSTSNGQFVVDIDGDGDVTSGGDLVVNVGTVVASDINFIVTGSAGIDTIRTGLGVDNVNAAGGNDVFVLVGSLSAADVAGYSAAGNVGGITVPAPGGWASATIGNVLSYNELLSTRTATEAVAGKTLNGGAGTDNLNVYGTADLTGMNIGADIEVLTVHSTVTLTVAQLNQLTNLAFAGNLPHTLIVVDALDQFGNGNTYQLTQAEINAILDNVSPVVANNGVTNVYVQDAGPLTTFTVGAGAPTQTPAQFQATVGYVDVAGTTVAAATGRYTLGLAVGAIVDNAANVVAAAPAVLAAATTVTVADTGAAIAAMTPAQLGSVDIDTIDASDNAISLTAAQEVAADLKLVLADVITVADTGANIAGMSAAQLGSAKIDTIDATNNAISLTAAQEVAADAKLVLADVITVADTGANIAAMTVAQLGSAKIDTIDASDNAISLTAAQEVAADAKLVLADAITVADTGANIAAMTAAQLGSAKIDTIDASDNAISLTAAQAIAADAKLVLGDVIRVLDTGAAIAGMSAAQLGSAKIDVIMASDNAISLTAAQEVAADAKLVVADVITVADTGAAIAGMTAVQLGSAKIDTIDANDNAISLTAAQEVAADAKLVLGDAITVADLGANIAGMSAAQLGSAKIDTIDASDNAISLTAAQEIAADAKLLLGDAITVADTGANIATMSDVQIGSAKIDTIDASDNAISLTAAQELAADAKLVLGDFITVADTGVAIAAMSAAQLASAKIDAIDATDNAITLTYIQQVTADAKLSLGDVITVADTSAIIQANLAALLANAKVDVIDSTEDAVAINIDAATVTTKLVAGDLINVSDTSANIQANLAALLADVKVDSIDSTENAVAINIFAATATTKLVANDTIVVDDNGAAIAAMTVAQIGDAKIDTIDASDGVISLTAAQAIAADAKLVVGDAITVADFGANIAAMNVAQLGSAKIDTIDATDNAISLSFAQEAAADAKLVVGDFITVADPGATLAANVAALAANAKVDLIDATDDALTLNFADAVLINAKLTGSDALTLSDTAANLTTQVFAGTGGNDILTVGAAGAATDLTGLTSFTTVNLGASAAANAYTVADGAVTVNLDAGGTSVILGTGNQAVNAGAGADVIALNAGNTVGNLGSYVAEVSDLGAGDTIDTAGNGGTTYLVDIASYNAATFAAEVNAKLAALAGYGPAANDIILARVAGNSSDIYAVVDQTGDSVSAADSVVHLVGTITVSLDGAVFI